MIDALFVDKWVILAATAPMYSVTAAMDSANLHKTAPTRFLPQEHHATKTDLVQCHDKPTPKGTDHTSPTMGTDMGDISTDHNHAATPTTTGTAAILEGTHCPPHPATTAVHTTFEWIDAPIITCATTQPTGIVTPHPTLTTSPTNITHATIPQTGVSLTPATLTAWHWEHSYWGKPSHIQDLHPPYIPPFQDCHHPGLPIRFFLRFRKQFWFFKLLEYSPISDEDEGGGQF